MSSSVGKRYSNFGVRIAAAVLGMYATDVIFGILIIALITTLIIWGSD